jgi:hypothetical protein
VYGRKLLTTEEDARSAFAEQENNGFEQTIFCRQKDTIDNNTIDNGSPLHSIVQMTDPN